MNRVGRTPNCRIEKKGEIIMHRPEKKSIRGKGIREKESGREREFFIIKCG